MSRLQVEEKNKTSMDVQKSGLYASDCCGVETTFSAGDTFQRCPQCSKLCIWELVQEGIHLAA